MSPTPHLDVFILIEADQTSKAVVLIAAILAVMTPIINAWPTRCARQPAVG